MADIGELPLVELIRGDYKAESMEFQDALGAAYDLTIYDDIIMDVRDNPYEDANLVFSISLGNGITIGGNNNELLIIEITSDNSVKFVTDYNQFSKNPTKLYTLTQNVNLNKPIYFFRDIRFIIDGKIVTNLNGKYKVINNISKRP